MQRRLVVRLADGVQLGALLLGAVIPRGRFTLILPLGPWTSMEPVASWIFTPAGTAIGFLPIRDIARWLSCQAAAKILPDLLPDFYQTSHNTSPPMCALRAARPVITPLGVVMMLIPMPPTTGRIPEVPR